MALLPIGVTPLGVTPPGVNPPGVVPPGVKLPGVPLPGVMAPGVIDGVMAPEAMGVSSHRDLLFDTEAEGVSSILSSKPLLALGVSAQPEWAGVSPVPRGVSSHRFLLPLGVAPLCPGVIGSLPGVILPADTCMGVSAQCRTVPGVCAEPGVASPDTRPGVSAQLACDGVAGASIRRLGVGAPDSASTA